MKHATSILALIVAVGLLSAATPGQAIYIQTPLVLDGETHEADVGDTIDVDIRPNPDDANATRDWAGKKVRVGYSFDKNENAEAQGPDGSTDNSGYTERFLPDDLTLSDKASGRFTWTVPEEVDDLNVHLFIEAADGERLAHYNIAIGDATPMMYVASGPSGGQPEIDDKTQQPLTNDDEAEEASALGLVGLVGALGAALVGASQLRRRH